MNAAPDPADEADADLLEAVLSELGPFTPRELAAGLAWTLARVSGAAERLEARLSATGLRALTYDGGLLAIETDLSRAGQEVVARLLARRGRPLGAIEAQQVLELVRSHVTDPRRRPGAQQLAGGEALIERGLARASYAADRFPAEGRLTAHPDVLYALGLISEPSPGRQVEGAALRCEGDDP